MSFLQNLKTAKSLNDVASLLGYQPKSLSYVIYKMPSKYETFSIAKKSGGSRTISAPRKELKLLQRRLSDGLQSCWEEINTGKNIKTPISHGFRKKCSILTNASVHRGRRFVFNIDIKNFFGSINFGRVYGFFVKNKDFALDENISKIIAAIACHDGKLPQGSPCSPVISNLIGQILDVRLTKIARKYGCSYSRYADDLTFSTNKRVFPSEIAKTENGHIWETGRTVTNVIEKSGFQLNTKKTRMQYCDSRQEVTGLIVNRRVNTRSEYRKLARAMTNSLVTTGKFHFKKIQPDAIGKCLPTKIDGNINHLQGMFGFIDWVDLRYKKNNNTMNNEPSSTSKAYKRFLMHRDFWASPVPVVLCEGKTDSIYLRSAIRSLASGHPNLITLKNEKEPEYKIIFFNYSYTSQRIIDLSGGSAAVLKFITSYIKSIKNTPLASNKQPLILLLDNDSGGKPFYSLIKEYSSSKSMVDGMADFYHLSANVYVVFTPIERAGNSTSIEDFFDPALLTTKVHGKSFNSSNEDIETSTEYGKAVFASKVIRPNIAKIDFSKFDEILRRIEKAIDAHVKSISK